VTSPRDIGRGGTVLKRLVRRCSIGALVLAAGLLVAACGTATGPDGPAGTAGAASSGRGASPDAAASASAGGAGGPQAASPEPSAGDGPAIGPSPAEYSFVVAGDTVGPGYLPFTESQWGIVSGLAERAAGYALDGGDGSLTAEPSFDPQSGLLSRLLLTVPGRAARQIDYRAGWPVRVVEVESGARRQTFRRAGQTWVYRSLAGALEPVRSAGRSSGPSAFLLHAGDMTFWGLQGRTAQASPFWRDLRERLLDRIAAADLRVGAVTAGGAGDDQTVKLSGRVLACAGNHETWGDPILEGMRGALPALEELGFAAERPVWAFDFGGARFVALDSEAFAGAGADTRPLDFGTQMGLLRRWLDEALEDGLRRVFVLYHRPSFTLGRVGGLPAATDPHTVLREYASDLDIVVFSGHVHTTEAFEVEGVRYVVCGAGGSEQELGTRPAPPGYPTDRYWNGATREEEYAYVEVRVAPAEVRLIVHRQRPSAPDLTETVELFAP
jgi:hypothetical protein